MFTHFLLMQQVSTGFYSDGAKKIALFTSKERASCFKVSPHDATALKITGFVRQSWILLLLVTFITSLCDPYP